jgi:hypothetical protein
MMGIEDQSDASTKAGQTKRSNMKNRYFPPITRFLHLHNIKKEVRVL